MPSRSDKLVWIDIETFGLDPSDPILEVGIMMTDLELKPIAETSVLVWDEERQKRLDAQLDEDAWVRNTHTKNKLFEACRADGLLPSAAESQLMYFVKVFDLVQLPVCGNSVHSDRGWMGAQMPDLNNLFHYRNIDFSTTKELCKRYNPELYSRLDEFAKKREKHRAIPDLVDSLNEARFYLDNFIFRTV